MRGGFPYGVMGGGAVFEAGGFVLINFVEIVGVLVFGVLEDVEAGSAGLVAFRADRIYFNRIQEFLPEFRFDFYCHPHCQHRLLLS